MYFSHQKDSSGQNYTDCEFQKWGIVGPILELVLVENRFLYVSPEFLAQRFMMEPKTLLTSSQVMLMLLTRTHTSKTPSWYDVHSCNPSTWQAKAGKDHWAFQPCLDYILSGRPA